MDSSIMWNDRLSSTMRIGDLVFSILILSFIIVPIDIHGTSTSTLVPTSTSTPGLMMTFVSEMHQANGPNCYNAQVVIQLNYNVTDLTGPYTIQIPNFYLYATGSNLQLSNSTNYQSPNNRIAFLLLFPNVPVALTLSFIKFCIPAGLMALQVWLFYWDGINTLKARIV
jgi:hypothetical protein